MANEEHLAKLREGVEAWNEWRLKNLDIQPDLQEEDLSGAQLKGADLGGAQLQKVGLFRAQLQKASLMGAQLQGAILGFAQLQEASLSFADLRGADLRGAQLQEASLFGAQLQGANLRGAFFDNATNLEEVILGDGKEKFALLADVSWGGANLAAVDWSPLKMLGDEYLARQSTSSIEACRTVVRANRQLAVVLRDQGLNEEADHFAYRAQLCQRVVWRRQRRWLKYIFSWFLYLLAGYGYRPLRSLLWYLVVIFGFALAYFALGHITPLEAFVLSLTSFHGRGFFPGTNITLSDPRVVLAAFEAVTGLFIEISFIATFTQRFFGR